ncbi:hypothetical protein ACFQS2_04365 [Brachybacterium sp. GCM10030267]|uniref:hypothetical protein n=1 Tax=unclassified Brachybacterium TaxID=2623841 RepID=UPI00361112E0
MSVITDATDASRIFLRSITRGLSMRSSLPLRRALVAAAALALATTSAACTSAGEDAAPTSNDGTSASDGQDPAASGEDTEPSDGEEGAEPSDGDGAGGAAMNRPPAVLYIVDGVSDVVDTDQETWSAAAGDIAEILADHTAVDGASEPSCDGDLTYEDGASVDCTAEFAIEGLDGQQDLTVMAVRAPSGYDPAGSPALLVSVGEPPSDDALEVFTDQGSNLVGVGQGSMFNAEEVPADELAATVESTVNSQNGYGVLDAPMVAPECSEPLPAGSTEPVECTVAWEHDPEVTFGAEAMGVWYLDSEPGLLVALDVAEADAAGDED